MGVVFVEDVARLVDEDDLRRGGAGVDTQVGFALALVEVDHRDVRLLLFSLPSHVFLLVVEDRRQDDVRLVLIRVVRVLLNRFTVQYLCQFLDVDWGHLVLEEGGTPCRDDVCVLKDDAVVVDVEFEVVRDGLSEGTDEGERTAAEEHLRAHLAAV